MAVLTYTYAPMNSGKSTLLLQTAFNYRENGFHTSFYTAAVDTRFGGGLIASRLGVTQPALTFNETTSFLTDGQVLAALKLTSLKLRRDATFSQEKKALFIDEAQFMTETQAREVHRLAHEHNITVHCYGLRADFTGRPFPGSATLLCLADEIAALRTLCECGQSATMHVRFSENGTRLVVGSPVAVDTVGNDSLYKTVCSSCFYRNDLIRPVRQKPDTASKAPLVGASANQG